MRWSSKLSMTTLPFLRADRIAIAVGAGGACLVLGALGIQYLGGIAPDDDQPGFKHIIMRPVPVGDLTFVRATHHSPYGLISSEWHLGKKFDWQIEIPANTTATVYVPATSAEKVSAHGLKMSRFEYGRAIFELGSGKYHFSSE